MADISLTLPKGLWDWICVYRLYRSAFPDSERKPFFIICRMFIKGRTDLWCIRKKDRFMGFAATVNGNDTILLDYLAILPQRRKCGIGNSALIQLKKIYSGKALFVEIECTDAPGEDQSIRLARKQFYTNAGMVPMHVTADVFGVKMELLGWDCHLDFDGYRDFYRRHYSPWAAEHIQPC